MPSVQRISRNAAVLAAGIRCGAQMVICGAVTGRGAVSGAKAQKTSEMSAMTAVVANAAGYPAASATRPASTGPMTAPTSPIIWNPASAVPLSASWPGLVMTSAIAAFVGTSTNPAPRPASSDATTNVGSDEVNHG